MLLLEQSLASAAENLALDEALLTWAETSPASQDVLRLWEFATPCVILGRGGRVDEEIDRGACESAGVTLLRRSSGGGTVVGGPGCLMYSLVLDRRGQRDLQGVTDAIAWVLRRLCNGLNTRLLNDVGLRLEMAGTSDLCLADPARAPVAWRKVSGNSLRLRPTHVLFHGTLLYDFDLARIEQWLRMPPRQPEYREDRPHAQFVTNLPVPVARLRAELSATWNADQPFSAWPRSETQRLAREKYSQPAWTYRH